MRRLPGVLEDRTRHSSRRDRHRAGRHRDDQDRFGPRRGRSRRLSALRRTMPGRDHRSGGRARAAGAERAVEDARGTAVHVGVSARYLAAGFPAADRPVAVSAAALPAARCRRRGARADQAGAQRGGGARDSRRGRWERRPRAGRERRGSRRGPPRGRPCARAGGGRRRRTLAAAGSAGVAAEDQRRRRSGSRASGGEPSGDGVAPAGRRGSCNPRDHRAGEPGCARGHRTAVGVPGRAWRARVYCRRSGSRGAGAQCRRQDCGRLAGACSCESGTPPFGEAQPGRPGADVPARRRAGRRGAAGRRAGRGADRRRAGRWHRRARHARASRTPAAGRRLPPSRRPAGHARRHRRPRRGISSARAKPSASRR